MFPNDQLMDDMGGSSGFIWEENDLKRWNEFVDTLPNETVDNWQSKSFFVPISDEKKSNQEPNGLKSSPILYILHEYVK